LEEKLKGLGFMPLGSDTGVFLFKTATGITEIDTHVDNGDMLGGGVEPESQYPEVLQDEGKGHI